jgi:hypothetical protein
MGNVVKLPRHARATIGQARQIRDLAVDLDLSREARAELANALFKITEAPGKRWLFVMINPEQFRFVAKAITQRPDAGKTLLVWNCAISHIQMDTGEIVASREKLAEDAGTLPRHVSTAMSELVKIGAIIRQRRGRSVAYFVNPHVGWSGTEGARQEAAEGFPRVKPTLTVVDGGRQ